MGMLWPYFLNRIIDQGSGFHDNLLFWMVTFLGCFLVGEVALRAAAYLFIIPISDTRSYVKSYFYNFVMNRSFSFVTMRSPGEIFNKLNQIYTSIDTLLDMIFWIFLSIAVNVCVASIMFIILSKYLGLIFLVWCILYTICIKKVLTFSHKKWKAFSKVESDIAGYIVNAIENFVSLCVYTNEKDRQELIKNILIENIDKHKVAQLSTIHAYFLQEIMTFLLGTASFVFCYVSHTMHGMKIEEIVMVISIFMILKERLHSLSIRIKDAIKSFGILSQALNDLYENSPLTIECHKKTFNDQNIDIELKNLSFSLTNHTLLKCINLKIEQKEKIALIGPSGSGKSTIANLVIGFYKPTSGEVLVNLESIDDFDQSSWYRHIAYVPQNPILLNGSIYENIRLGNLHATYQEVVEAAKKARCHDFISSLTDGYMTYAGSAGIKLSGGQIQKICIARAILKNAPFLIFDEPTSAVDYHEESQLLPILFEYLRDKTILYITHRSTKLVSFDRIIKVCKGSLTVENE
ncbi:MAG: ABC transporter ATP-binding protein/permease [Amoebophilaceae bacterium]|nr:ABC transporter ATP-binding protein/permease [Amoebophilaceae bacterium]